MKMEQKVKVRKLCGEGFRGILKKASLDFEEDCRSLVLYGNNGDGKSSFCDAVEWFFTDRINYLGREGCGREDYFYDALPKTQEPIVSFAFNRSILDGDKTLKRAGGYRFSNGTEDFGRYIGNSSKELFILRYNTMREFIDKTKKKKLEDIEGIIGFGIVAEIREALLRALNGLRNSTELKELRGASNERGDDIVKTIGTKPFIEADVISFADELRKQLGHDEPISDIDSFKSVTDGLCKKVETTGKGKQIAWLEQVRVKASSSKQIPDFVDKLKQVLIHHNELAAQKEKVEASALDKLYQAGVEALEKGWAKPGECPLCKRPIDTDQLLVSLKEEVEAIQYLLEERNENIEQGKLLQDGIPSLKESLSSLLEDKVRESVLTPNQLETLKSWADLFDQWKQLMNRVKDSPVSIAFDLPSIDSLNELKTTLSQVEEAIEGKKKSLAETEEAIRFYQGIQKLESLRDTYIRLTEIASRIQMYEKQISSLGKIYQEFEEKEQEGLSRVLEAISESVNEYFKSLHPDDDFDEIKLVLTEERGLEFSLEFYGRPISPPLKVLSESHLNSLGISLFLASSQHFNRTNGFLILDDIVSSFDVNHRRSLSRLLRDKFPDTQFLLFTHDDLWFDLLKRDLPSNRWLFKELAKWSHENGVEIIESPMTSRERIQQCLEDNDTAGAANKCRTLIEGILKEICEDLGVRLEYCNREKNDQREASELIDGLTHYLKENKSLRERENKLLFSDLRADQLLTNIGSHHRNLEVTSLSRGDIEMVLRDIHEFESLFICSDCSKPAQKSYSPVNSDLKQCKCGNLWI
ncbi:MAG: hypothetical protein NWF11_00960 [Candidatus Bathyarchaeota archaeon]|nr:hypothetical protein [Candidatus Bathyarchaeota archaeon]